jgi:hypothetical protein
MLEDLFKDQKTLLLILLIIVIVYILIKKNNKQENFIIPGLSTISIKSPHADKYCAIHPEGKVICDANGIGPWEKITIENTSSGNKTLKSIHGKYCAVEDNNILNCNRDAVGNWEQYNIENISDNTIAIKSLKTNQYCSIQPDGNIECNRDTKGPWEILNYNLNSIPSNTNTEVPTGLPSDINYVKGWTNNHENPGGKVKSAEDCRQHALNSNGRYVAWGYRKSNHPDEQAKNTCFLYTKDLAPYNGDPNDEFHFTGCLVSGDNVSSGCEKSKQYSANITAAINAENIKNLPSNINYVKGWTNNHENPGGKVKSAEDCRQQALNSKGKYVAWGYRKSNHPDEQAKNTCFLYTKDLAPYNGDPNDEFHLTGCLVPGDTVSSGCEKSKMLGKPILPAPVQYSIQPQTQTQIPIPPTPTPTPMQTQTPIPTPTPTQYLVPAKKEETVIPLPQNYAACGQDGDSCQFEFQGNNDVYYGVENKKLVKIPARSMTSGKFSCSPLGRTNQKGYPSLPVHDPLPGSRKSCYVRK